MVNGRGSDRGAAANTPMTDALKRHQAETAASPGLPPDVPGSGPSGASSDELPIYLLRLQISPQKSFILLWSPYGDPDAVAIRSWK